MPKPLIIVNNKHMIDWAMDSIDYSSSRIIFVVRQDHVEEFGIDKVLKDKYGENTVVVSTDKITRGTLSTCLLAEKYINNGDSLVVYTPDVCFEPKFSIEQAGANDGFVLTFKANSPAHSYVKMGKDGYALATAEKQVISDLAAVGIYYFKRGSSFVNRANEMIDRDMLTNNEFYVCPIYNLFIENGEKITSGVVDKMHVLGTPSDVHFFTQSVIKRFGKNKPVALCSDHSGVASKKMMIKELESIGISYIDFGTYIERSCDQYDFLSQVLRHMDEGLCDFGMGFCRTGQSFNIYANKHKSIRSAMIFDEYTAEYSIRHNCANFFCIPEKYVNEESIRGVVKGLTGASFDGGRHFTRIQKFEKNA